MRQVRDQRQPRRRRRSAPRAAIPSHCASVLRCDADSRVGSAGRSVDQRVQHREHREAGRRPARRGQAAPHRAAAARRAGGRHRAGSRAAGADAPNRSSPARRCARRSAESGACQPSPMQHEKVGAVPHLRDSVVVIQPNFLQHVEVAVLRRGCPAWSSDRAESARERERRAHAGDIGAETADQRPARRGAATRCGVQRRVGVGASPAMPRRARPARACPAVRMPLGCARKRRARGASCRLRTRP